MLQTVGLEEFGWELGEVFEKVERFEEQKQEYTSMVDSYQRGEVSPEEMESAVYEMASSINDLQDEIIDVESIYSRAVGAFETSGSEVPAKPRGANEEMAEHILEEGFEIVTSPTGSNYSESATENEIAYHSFVESYGEPDFIDEEITRGEQIKQIIDKVRQEFDAIEDEASDYRAQFLHENLNTTVSGAYLDIQDGYVEAAFDQELEMEKAKKIRDNPNDVYIGGFKSEKEFEDLDEARRKVREETPRGKVENEGPSKEEIEKNNEGIKQKREEVRKREDRGIY